MGKKKQAFKVVYKHSGFTWIFDLSLINVNEETLFFIQKQLYTYKAKIENLIPTTVPGNLIYITRLIKLDSNTNT